MSATEPAVILINDPIEGKGIQANSEAGKTAGAPAMPGNAEDRTPTGFGNDRSDFHRGPWTQLWWRASRGQSPPIADSTLMLHQRTYDAKVRSADETGLHACPAIFFMLKASI
jgi:hypothetical protein